MSAVCIFCRKEHEDESVEHIVPRSLGNLHYILGKGSVCATCNNRFGRFENKVLSSEIFLEERRARGLLRPGKEEQGIPLEARPLTKFLAKMAYESFYRSQKQVWEDFDSEPLRQLLVHGHPDKVIGPIPEHLDLVFRNIPSWFERFRLRNNGLALEYATHENTLYFRFSFGRIVAGIRVAYLKN